MCGTCTQNKHECAGYGAETDHSPTDGGKEAKRAARRESNASSNTSTPKLKQEATPQPSRPPLPDATSTTSHISDSPANSRPPKRDMDNGTTRLDQMHRKGRQLTFDRKHRAHAEHTQSHALLPLFRPYSYHARLQTDGCQGQRKAAWNWTYV